MKRIFLYVCCGITALALNAGCSSDNKSNNDVAKTGPTENEQAEDTGISLPTGPLDKDLERIKLPQGFRIDYYAKGVENARSMAISPSGIVFVGTRTEDKVYAVVDENRDGKADEVVEIASGLNSPNGVAFKDGDLYVGEINRIIRFRNIEQSFRNKPQFEVVTDTYPSDAHHGWKYIAFGPDGKLYVPVGAPCNICKSDNPVYATITRINEDGTGQEIYAEGVRNSVGFAWHPETEELWFTDNGRDMLGNDVPSDELNRAPQKGLHFGYPYCHQGDISDPEFGNQRNCNEFEKPVQKLGAHVASLGFKFYTGNMFPAKYKNQIIMAQHGSWNRDSKVGYRLMTVTLEGNKAVAYEPFAEGWLEGEDDWGRPVDVVTMRDGSLLVSDDKHNAIYRITYSSNAAATANQ
ncbi:sorbosone dehydrogenase family protein [Pontibacter sp. SGAir0037]|uniref:PQQ-dependent sugar dehydrogenase n=1 Tax=Pontibacter sp. SGAir0037 TaxID=2571030 RepID=UPI0010CD2EE1|nr:sorbosone dehydrogenase family protein [Pontibacter sp. SGAir0037]QCR24429.1 sorbosone dehydrogenase [Pontibacter sp. SGAir0037]